MDNTENAAGLYDGPSSGEITGAVILFVFQVVAAVPFYILTIFFSFASDGCSEPGRNCNYVIAGGALYLAPLAALCALAVTIPLTIRSGKRGGSVVVSPLLGLISVIVFGILGLVLNYVALK